MVTTEQALKNTRILFDVLYHWNHETSCKHTQHNCVAELPEDIIMINTCSLISYEYALHLCVYRLAIFSSAGQLMIAGQLENEECDYEFCPHSCTTMNILAS